jgi:acetyltransferase-like isoleucine patch superfamily enzyme
MGHFLNPKRKRLNGVSAWLLFYLKLPLIELWSYLGFLNIEYSYLHGDKERMNIGNGCSTTNTLFNTVSGNITIGDDTIFGHNCMVLTGRHRFYQGRRAKLVPNSEHFRETPESGFDIEIGEGCFIGSGAIILAPVKIGDNVIVGAGSLIIKDIPSNCFVAGVPAKIVSFHKDGSQDT